MSSSSAIIGAGLLGRLAYDYNEDRWAIELGEWLEYADAAFRGDTRIFHRRDIRSARDDAFDNIFRTCQCRGMPTVNKSTIDFEKGGFVQIHIVHHWVLKVCGASALALVCVGQCAWIWKRHQSEDECWLEYQMKLRMDVIDQYCPELKMSTEAITRALRELPIGDAAPSRLLMQLARPLTILFMAADPDDEGPLENAKECREIKTARRETRFSDSLQIHAVSSCRTQDISAALDGYEPNILHFSGHGTDEGLCFENIYGRGVSVKKKALARLLATQKNLKLVVLSSCFSLGQAQAIADAVGMVIGTTGSLEVSVAIDFAREFYRALGYGRTFEDAFERAKLALGLTSTLKIRLLKKKKQQSRLFDPNTLSA